MAYTVQYYDVVLAAIIVALALGGVVGAFTPVAMPVAVVGLGAVSIGLIGHAMFVNGPVDEFEDLTDEVEADRLTPENVPLLE